MARRARWLLVCGAVLCGNESGAQTRDPQTSITELKRLSLQQLTDVEVTSVSRIEERLEDAAAAVAVVTNEDLRRSGATTLPEALRLLPGIHVARQTSNTWAVGSRGLSSVNSGKLLVLADTRSIYTPLFSGVFWDVQGLLLQDVERIEVIRGPGATLWGSNAVNGVINVTTKPARDTQGLYAETTVGTEERASLAVRYGGRAGDGGYYRVFGTYADRDASFVPPGPTEDDWRLGQVGARMDWGSPETGSLTIQGAAYHGNVGRVAPSVTIFGRPGPMGDLTVDVSGGHVLGRYLRRAAGGSDLEVRVYYDRTHRDDPSFLDDLHTFDAELQQRIAAGARHELTWGVSHRVMANRNEGKGVFALNPTSATDNVTGGFVQDQMSVHRTLHLTVGTKLEGNGFSGFEVQPSVRALWNVADGRTLWAAASRAVRVPTRLERDIAIDVTDPAGDPVARLVGNEDFDSETVLAFEGGYRWRLSEPIFVDVTGFHNRYDGLASLELESPFVDPASGRTVIPLRNRNLTDGRAQGVELLATVRPRVNWRVTVSHAYLDVRLDPRGQDLNRGVFLDGATPRHQFGLRSFLDLPAGVQLDGQLRALSAVRRLPSVVSGEGLDGYAELDVRVAWRGAGGLELSVVGQNLLHARHAEFGAPDQRGAMERSVYTRAAWGF